MGELGKTGSLRVGGGGADALSVLVHILLVDCRASFVLRPEADKPATLTAGKIGFVLAGSAGLAFS